MHRLELVTGFGSDVSLHPYGELVRRRMHSKVDPIREAASDFMGEWRLLRNWLEHPSLDGHAEKQYFNGAEAMVRLLGSQRGKPEVTVGDVFLLMDQLNALNITVNPLKQEPVVQFVEMDPETLAKIQGQMGPNDRLISW